MKLKTKMLVGGCVGEKNGWNTQLLYFIGPDRTRICIPSTPATGEEFSSTAHAAVM